MLIKFEFEDCKLASTPVTVGCKINKEDEYKNVYKKSYRSMIGSLLYVTTSRPNVKQVVGMVAIFQSTPKENHVQAVKRIFKYLKGTINLGLWYPRKKSFSLRSYLDAN